MHCSSGILAGLLLNVVEIKVWEFCLFFFSNSVLCLNIQKEKNQIWKWSSEMRDVILNLRNRPELPHSHQESPKQTAA